MGTVVWSAMASLGEMTALFPIRQPIIDFPSRYIDESVGFATGWMAWLAFSFLIGVELSVVAELFQFGFSKEYLQSFNYPQETLQWTFGLNTNPNVWVAILLVVIFLMNLLPIRVYGEIEYFFGCIKIVVMVGLIMFNLIVNAVSTKSSPKINPLRPSSPLSSPAYQKDAKTRSVECERGTPIQCVLQLQLPVWVLL
jgi:yeast amino acid transporter